MSAIPRIVMNLEIYFTPFCIIRWYTYHHNTTQYSSSHHITSQHTLQYSSILWPSFTGVFDAMSVGNYMGKYAALDCSEKIQRIRCTELPGMNHIKCLSCCIPSFSTLLYFPLLFFTLPTSLPPLFSLPLHLSSILLISPLHTSSLLPCFLSPFNPPSSLTFNSLIFLLSSSSPATALFSFSS